MRAVDLFGDGDDVDEDIEVDSHPTVQPQHVDRGPN